MRRCKNMWRCEKMWRWEDVKMRRCEDEKMRRRWADEEKMRRWGEDVRMRRCEDEKMWRWEDVKMRRCEDEKMRRRCEDEKMWGWEDVKMRRWGEDEQMRRRWEDEEKMWGWEDVRMRRCEDEKMWRWEDVKMRRWGEDVRMRRCEDEKMWRWEDVKMRRCLTDPHYWKNPALRRSREIMPWFREQQTKQDRLFVWPKHLFSVGCKKPISIGKRFCEHGSLLLPNSCPLLPKNVTLVRDASVCNGQFDGHFTKSHKSHLTVLKSCHFFFHEMHSSCSQVSMMSRNVSDPMRPDAAPGSMSKPRRFSPWQSGGWHCCDTHSKTGCCYSPSSALLAAEDLAHLWPKRSSPESIL